MPRALTPHQLISMRRFEPQLREALKAENLSLAEDIMKKIQSLFEGDRNHFRLLQAKNWYYEGVLEAGKLEDAKLGLEAVRKRAREGTRVFIEATALLAVCCLRLKKIDEAKKHLRFVIQNINSISSDRRRNQFQKRVIERIDEEFWIGQLVGRNEGVVSAKQIQEDAVKLLREKSPEQIFELIGDAMPSNALPLLKDVKDYAILLLPPPDQKLLEPPKQQIPKAELGKKALAAIKRIGWKAFCHQDSQIYKLWKNRIPKVFNEGYFAVAFTTVLAQWRIGLPQFGAGVVAIVMKYSCEEFCSTFKPEGLMIPRGENDAHEV